MRNASAVKASFLSETQQATDVAARLQLVNHFNELAGPITPECLERQRSYIFGTMTREDAAACTQLYRFVIAGASARRLDLIDDARTA